MSCNCNKHKHVLESVAVTETNVVLTVSNSTNIGSLDNFELVIPCCKSVSDFTGEPLPVQINVNGEAVNLYNKYSLPILSNRVPRRAKGAYVVSSGVGYVILFTTPYCKANA